MSLFVDTESPSPEVIQRAVFYTLFEKVNAALVEIAEASVDSDKEIALLRGQDYVPTDLEPVEKVNFYEGFRPPMIDRPIGEYPNVSVVVNRAVEAPESAQYDHQSVFRNSVVVEAMVKASEAEGEEICNRRAQRMRNALMWALESDTTLNGAVDGFQPGMTSQLSTLFSRNKNEKGYGGKFLWQAVQIEFSVNKYTARNSGSTENFRQFLSPGDPGIDQA
jgi:hypothetical protein